MANTKTKRKTATKTFRLKNKWKNAKADSGRLKPIQQITKVEQPDFSLSKQRRQAIEKAIEFWKHHSVNMSGFAFNREEANAR